MMKGVSLYTAAKKPTNSERLELVDFLFQQLGKYGDPKEDISKCLEFALEESPKALGGFALVIYGEHQEILGATIVNKTGMSNYIPENILVYIAVDEKTRGQGIGKKLVQSVLETMEGSIALHVDRDNPAIHLYERLGFETKYLEMRYEK